MILSTNQLHKLFSQKLGRSKPVIRLRQSAVMVILLDKVIHSVPTTHIVFIMKALDGSRHSGQMAFPGGNIEPNDHSALATALRETKEEINIGSDKLDVLGTIGYMSTMATGYDAAIYLAKAKYPLHYIHQENEVAAIFEIPLTIFYEQNRPNLQLKNKADLLRLHYHIDTQPFLQVETAGWPRNQKQICVWGFTARVLNSICNTLM